MSASVKICGLSTPETLDAAVDAGARYVGFVFYPRSPRAVTPQQAAQLALRVPPGVAKVGLFVDPEDADLEHILSIAPLDMIQIHDVVDPARLKAIKTLAKLPMIVAAPIETEADVDRALDCSDLAEMILFDAKPSNSATLPGGNGVAFDWRLLSTRRIAKPWMLAGGLDPENVAQAVALTGAKTVDVSTGVESEPGVKDPKKIAAFTAALTAPVLHV